MKKILGLAPNVFLLGLVSLFNDFSSEMIYAVMPAFLVGVLGAPAIFVGFLEGFAEALSSVLKIFSGWFSDKIGRRKIIAVSGYSLSTATRFFLASVTNFWQVFILRAIDRVGKGFRDAPRDALLTESVEELELGKSFGFHRTMDTIGSILGPAVAIAVLPIIGYQYPVLFLIAFGAGILGLCTFVFVRETKHRLIKTGGSVPFSLSLSGFNRQFKLFLASIFIFGLGLMPTSLVLLKSQESGFDGRAVPLMYLVYSLAFVLFAIPFGRASDRLGEKRVMVWGFLAAMLSYAVFALTGDAAGTVLGFVILGFYSAMTDGVGRAFVSKLVERDKLATGQGFLQAAIGVSSLLAGLLGGAIWTYARPQAAFVYGIVMMTIGLLIFNSLNVKARAV